MTRRFAALFWRQAVRGTWRHPLLAILNIASIALGVGVFLAIQIANRGALESFRTASELTTGRADLEIRGDLDDAILPAVAVAAGVRVATPLLEGVVSRPDAPGEYLRILGVDPFTGTDVFAFKLQDASERPLDFEKWLRNPEAVAIQPALATTLGGRNEIAVLTPAGRRVLKPAFVFVPDDLAAGADTRAVAMDIGWAQELLGRHGRLTSIQILLDDPQAVEAVTQELRKILPADVVVAPPVARSREMAAMLGAFQLNLTAMSLVSVIVGMFLIFNSVGAAVVRRRTDIAILRSAGATRGEVRLLFLGEAALHGVLGAVLGLWLAEIFARWIASPVSLSVSALYELVRIENIHLAPRQAALGLGVGLLTSLIAAWLPASEAARCEPARILHPGAGMELFTPLRKRGLAAAFLFLALAFLLSAYVLRGGPKLLGFAAAAAVLAGFSLLVPWLAAALAACLRGAGLLVRLAADYLVRSLHRHALTIAALAAAVAMTISVTVMIHSFRASVLRWTEHTLIADLYIAPAINEIGGQRSFLPAGAEAWAAGRPEVRETATFREMPVPFRGRTVSLVVINGKARGNLEFVDGPDARRELESLGPVAISESLANRFGLARGREISLPTPGGERNFPICGVYRDFSRDQGAILMPRTLFARYWQDERIHSLALKLHDPAQGGALGEAFRQRFGTQGEFSLYDNAALRRRVLEIFDQTFAVTSILRSIAILVAVTGVLFCLSALVIEREREIGVLRAVGASRPQVLGIFLGEAALIGLTASLSGLASGGALAMVLTWVINRAFFGWTIELSYPWQPLALTPLWLVPVAVLAALLPAWRAAHVAPARAVRFE